MKNIFFLIFIYLLEKVILDYENIELKYSNSYYYFPLYFPNNSQKFEYTICTETLDGLLISIDKISEEICGQILDNENSKYFCWISSKCYTKIIGDCLGFSFDNNEDSETLKKILDKCLYETKNKQPYENIDEDNRKILEKATDYNNIDCFSSDEDEKKEEEKKENSKKNREEILDLDEKFKEIDTSKEILNKFCINSLSNDRTFCITDNNEIVVYKAPMISSYKSLYLCSKSVFPFTSI